MIGAVVCGTTEPDVVVTGRYRPDGTLVIVGRTVPLTPTQAAQLLTPASAERPWPDTVLANRFSRGRDRIASTRVEPALVAEISADSAQQGGCGDTYASPTDSP